MGSTGKLSQNSSKGNKNNLLLKNSSSTQITTQQMNRYHHQSAIIGGKQQAANNGNYNSGGGRKNTSKMNNNNSQHKFQGHLSKINTVGQASENSIITLGSLDNFAIRGAPNPQPTAFGQPLMTSHERSTSQNSRGVLVSHEDREQEVH